MFLLLELCRNSKHDSEMNAHLLLKTYWILNRFFTDRFHFPYFFTLLDNFHFFPNVKNEILFFYINKNKHFFSSVCFTDTSGFVGTTLLCVFNILSFSTKFRCCVLKHVFLFAKFPNTKLFDLIRGNVEKEHEALALLLINIW